MSTIAALDIACWSVTAMLAASLFLMVLGAGPRRMLNRSFALFALAEALAAILNILRDLSLRFDVGNALFLTELLLLFSIATGPLLGMFIVLYLNRRTRNTNLIVGMGIIALVILCVPLFRHQLYTGIYLDDNGIARTSSNIWRVIAVQLATLYNVWALVLFWQERRRLREPYLAWGVFVLVGGHFVNGVFRPSFPITSATTALAVAILGYGIITRQLFNPLRDMTQELERKVEELRQSEERFRVIFEGSNDAVMLLSEKAFFDCNSRALEMFDFGEKGELVGIHLADISPPFQSDGQDSVSAAQERIHAAFQQGHNRFEWIHSRGGGEDFLAEVLLSAFDLGGEMVLQATVRDISERKQIEAEHKRLQQEVIESQRQALLELSSPVIPIMERIIVMPLIGIIDSKRARDITRALLAGIRQHRAKVVILDITGVPVVDSGVANYLNKTIQAARLKGARTIVTGISDAVAETIVDLGIDWGGVETLNDLQTGLIVALGRLGIKLAR
ncbi:MAG: PAS domain S-box protein [Chloroflexi bacterium]|nr:PAS domain S-box protein [Chloroflexota bacterium]